MSGKASSDFQKLIDQIMSIQGKSTATKVDTSSPFNISTLGQTNPNMFSDIKLPNLPISSSSNAKDLSGFKPDIFGMLNGTLGQVGGAITDNVYTNLKNFNDKNKTTAQKLVDFMLKGNMGATLLKGIANGGKEQWKDWTDGKASWGDVPLVGFLHGMEKGWKRGEDIMTDVAGVNNRWGKVAGGIGIDVALDPLTYLTGGLSTATKLSKVAELKEINKISKAMKLGKKFKNVDDLKIAATQAVKAETIKTLSAAHAQSISSVANQTRQQYAKFPNLVESMVKRKVDEHQALLTKNIDNIVTKKVENIVDSIKTAKNTTFKNNINKWGMSIPFSNKATAAIGDIKNTGIGKAFYRSEATVGNKLVDDLLKAASHESTDLQQVLTKVTKQRYGVNSLDELTKTHFDDLFKHMEPLTKELKGKLPHADITSKIVKHAMPEEDFTRLMDNFTKQNIPWKDVQKQLEEILKQTGGDSKLRSSFGSHLAQMVSDYWVKKPRRAQHLMMEDAQKAQSMKWASKFLKESDTYKTVENTVDKIHKGSPEGIANQFGHQVGKTVENMLKKPYNEMPNMKTGFEHWMDSKNPFNARTLKTGDKFVDSMGDVISDANSRKLGEKAMYERGLASIQQFVKKNNIKPETMKEAIYHLEGKAPTSLGKDWKASDEAVALANKIKPLIDEIGKDDVAAGVLSKLRKNYFPHVLKRSDDELKKMVDFDKKSGLNGLSSVNKFDKQRKSFETIADRDNYIEKLQKAIVKEKDADTKALLQQQMDRVADMFDTDVVSVMTRRIGEGVRSRAMKEMQTDLSKYGMMKTIKKGSGDIPPSGYHKIDKDEARKLGLGEGEHYIHPDVYKGLQRVDEIFTNQGMEKWKRHMAAIADIWRPLVTYYNPVHYTNNLIGNAIVNMAAGVKASEYKAAGKLLKGWKKGTLNEAEIELMKSAYKHNVVSGGFLFDSKPTFKFDDPSKLEKFAKFVSDNKVIKASRRKGEHWDDITRLANYINGIDKYGSTAHAAKQVRTYLFNYNELTNADRMMRVIVPFWNWTKNNIPLQMKLLMEMPKFGMNHERFRDLFNKEKEGADYQKDSGIKIPHTDRYLRIQSPFNDMQDLVNEPATYGLSSLHPVPRMGMELWGNKKILTGQPISRGSRDVQAKDLPDYIASNTGIGGKVYNLATGKDSFMDFLGKLMISNSKIK